MNDTLSAFPFTVVFLSLLGISFLVQSYLAYRQRCYVVAHAGRVPSLFAAHIPPEQHEKAAQYAIAKSRFGQIQLLFHTLMLLWLTLGGGFEWLQQMWTALLPSGIAQQTVVLLSVFAVLQLVELPFLYYSHFHLEARFGFNRLSRRLFVLDILRGALLGAVLGGGLIAALLALMVSAGEQWWLWAWGLWVGFSVLLMVIFPLWIAPLFNRFTPLADVVLKDRVERLLQRCGFDSQGIFVMDSSKRSAHGNAYFTGFGRAKRIVFFDTLLDHLSHDEIEAVLAHELGHFHHQHIRQRLWGSIIFSLLLFAVLGVLADTSAFYQQLGVNTVSAAAALFLFSQLLPLLLFPLTPLFSALSRRQEYQADEFAAQHAPAAALISALTKLYRDNAATLTPDPLHSAFYDSHPPATARVAKLQGFLS